MDNNSDTSKLQEKRILLVDDEPSVVHALCLLLEALGFTVSAHVSGKDALDDLRERGEQNDGFDLMLCDLRMPEMDGIEVLRATRELQPTLPVILMSAHASDEDVQQATALGISGFLNKPFTPDQLLDLVASL